ncbi:hypothetical protein GOV12_04940 [Candidatus Pacearchaeota archaeon]|nr:hypothetical protein [Candidatus Pacearchaeota archaeon]
MINKNKRNRKKGVSEVVGYVILISIALGIALGVFGFLKLLVPMVKPAIDCKEGTSVILDQVGCIAGAGPGDTGYLELIIKNNGRFKVDGVLVTIGNDADKTPVTYLKPQPAVVGFLKGHYQFSPELNPSESLDATFDFIEIESDGTTETDIVDGYQVKTIQIQPFILDGKKKIVCTNTVFTDDKIQGCDVIHG